MAQDYKDLALGFDRTQLYKEHVQPQINRASALSAVMQFCQLNDLKLSMELTLRLCDLYVKYIETGDKEWVRKVDEYLTRNN